MTLCCLTDSFRLGSIDMLSVKSAGRKIFYLAKKQWTFSFGQKSTPAIILLCNTGGIGPAFLLSSMWRKLWIMTWCNRALWDQIDGLVQRKRKSIAKALELRLSWTNPSRCTHGLRGEYREAPHVCAWILHSATTLKRRSFTMSH